MSEKSLCAEKKWDEGIFEVTVKQAVKCSLSPAGHLDLATHAGSPGLFTHEQPLLSG